MDREHFLENMNRILDLNNQQQDRFNAALGLELVDCDPGEEPWVEYRYEGREAHRNPYGGIHGGIISALADTCSGMGAVGLTGCYVTTTELQMSFIRAMAGNRFRIRVEYSHVGRTLVRCIGRIREEDTGKLMATSMATFMVFADKPPGLQD